MPEKRVLVIVGDGAFQETCQAVSSHSELGHNTVVFVLVNGIYGIEQKLVNPNPFRTPPKHYQDQLLNNVYSYNRLHDWHYEKLMDVFGGEGRVVETVEALSSVLAEIDARPRDNFLVHVQLPITDTPKALKPGLGGVGEDETANVDWPPALLF